MVLLRPQALNMTCRPRGHIVTGGRRGHRAALLTNTPMDLFVDLVRPSIARDGILIPNPTM
jgi:hypothetical protein